MFFFRVSVLTFDPAFSSALLANSSWYTSLFVVSSSGLEGRNYTVDFYFGESDF